MNNILVSIITVCFNSEKTIKATIESVLKQTYSNIEYIIIDGKSNDKTIEIINSYIYKFNEKKINISIISEKDNGIYDAMNKGIQKAEGELIGLINSDDSYEDNAIQKIVEEYNKDKTVSILHGLLKYYDSNQLSMIRGCNSNILKNHMIEHPTCFIKKNTYIELGGYNCKYKYAADYDFLLRAKLKGYKFKLIDSIIAKFYDGGAGDCIESRVEALKVRRKYGTVNLIKYYILIFKIKVEGLRNKYESK